MRTKDSHQVHARAAHVVGRVGGEVGDGEEGGELAGFVGGGGEDGLGCDFEVGGICDVLEGVRLAPKPAVLVAACLLTSAVLRKLLTVWTSFSH